MVTAPNSKKQACGMEFVGFVKAIPEEDRNNLGLLPSERLRLLCLRGRQRVDAVLEGRLNQELQVIQELNLSGFFLALWDIHRFAINAGHVIILDGPASGSFVVHQLGLSPVDPLRHRLLFERFLDPKQTYAPMRKFNISEGGLEEVVRYARSKFFWDDTGNEERPWRAFSKEWQSPAEGTTDRATIDIMVHPGLSLIKQVVHLIQGSKGREIIPSCLPENDEKTLKLFQQGDTEGVYYFQDGIINDLLQKMKIEGIGDLMAADAFGSDGHFDNGLMTEFPKYQSVGNTGACPQPLMDEILGKTNGALLYQEQIMEIVQRIGGLDLREGFFLQKALSKENQQQINQIRGKFANGAKKKQIDAEFANTIFESIISLGKNTVCKANSAITAFIGYQIAFLRAHFSEEFSRRKREVIMQPSRRI